MKTILAPIDFSPVTNQVLIVASALARSYEGRVVLLNVTPSPAALVDYGGFAIDYAEVTELAARSATKELEALQEKLENDFVTAEVIHLVGAPVPEIIEQAKILQADYIVMGSHGHTALYDLMVGGTTSGVMHRAPCQVVVVPPPVGAKKNQAPKRVASPAQRPVAVG